MDLREKTQKSKLKGPTLIFKRMFQYISFHFYLIYIFLQVADMINLYPQCGLVGIIVII